jgi:hypothetical protein
MNQNGYNTESEYTEVSSKIRMGNGHATEVECAREGIRMDIIQKENTQKCSGKYEWACNRRRMNARINKNGYNTD